MPSIEIDINDPMRYTKIVDGKATFEDRFDEVRDARKGFEFFTGTSK